MDINRFNAKCPFEVGDTILNTMTGAKHKITDIACTHYCKSGKVEFSYQLDNSPNYVRLPVSEKSVSISITIN